MDDPLPSYESALVQDPWELIAPYLPSADLCASSLVCSRWHAIFAPQLWGAPASHFGVENDIVYVALTRFKRTLYWARLSVRTLTHTLCLPPAHAEVYGGPHSDWLRDCLERLPRLQSLLVTGLPFLDHASLLTLKYPSMHSRLGAQDAFPVFNLRMLEAPQCPNITSTGLVEALPHFPDLVSLDLSRTSAARNEAVLSKLKHLRSLRVLKLRGLDLKDNDFATIASGIGTRVRSLDISDNHLTDASVRVLLEECMTELNQHGTSPRSPLPPVRHGRPTAEVDDLAVEDLEHHIRTKLTQGFAGSLAVERPRHTGVTHLYLSDNLITVEGYSGLLRAERLQVLDIGKVCSAAAQKDALYTLPGIEKLTGPLVSHGAKKLKYLRIEFDIITKDGKSAPPSPRPAELGGSGPPPWADASAPRLEVDAFNTGVYELPAPYIDSSAPRLELDAFETGVYELPGSFAQPAPDRPNTESPRINSDEIRGPERRSPGDSPRTRNEPNLAQVTQESIENDSNTLQVVDATSLGGRLRSNSSDFVADRVGRLQLRQSWKNTLHPGALPKLQTLVLTDVPTTCKKRVVERLLQFIEDCAEEAEIAKQRAKNTYTLPPGRSRKDAEREHARDLFGLRRIVLEMAPPNAGLKTFNSSRMTKSSTEDRDSENLWEAAGNDFSFFSGEESGIRVGESELPLAAMSGLIATSSSAPGSVRVEPTSSEPTMDLIAELGRFRRGKKAEYDSAARLGAEDVFVEGCWAGKVTVVRRLGGQEAVEPGRHYH